MSIAEIQKIKANAFKPINTPKDITNNNTTNSIFDIAPTKGPNSDDSLINECSAVASGSDNSDYKPDSPDDKNGSIENTKQRGTGNCAFLSSITSLSYTEEGRKLINEALEYQDGKTIVHLKGVGDYVVSDAELADVRKQNKQYSTGDDDMLIFELALEKVYDDIINEKIDFNFPKEYNNVSWAIESSPEEATTIGNSSTRGSFPLKVYYLLTGKLGKHTKDKEQMNELLDKFEKDSSALAIAPVSGFKEHDRERLDGYGLKNFYDAKTGEEIELINTHGYSLKKVEGNIVTITNPWDTSKEINLSREDFCNNFYLQSCDLSDNNPEVDYIVHNADYSKYIKEEYGGSKYNTENVLDKDGNLKTKKIRQADGNIEIVLNYDSKGNITHSNIIQYNDKNEQINGCGLSGDHGLNILERGLLDSRFTFDDLMIDNGISSLTDEEWEIAKDLIHIPALKEQLNGSNITSLAKMDEYDRKCALETFITNPKADRNTVIWMMNFTNENINDILNSNDPEAYLKDIEKDLGNYNIANDRTWYGARDYKELVERLNAIKDQLGETGLTRVANRNLLCNPLIPQKLSAHDIYVLAFISDDNWDKALELWQKNPDMSAWDVYEKTK